MDILTLEFWAISEDPPILPECILIRRQSGTLVSSTQPRAHISLVMNWKLTDWAHFDLTLRKSYFQRSVVPLPLGAALRQRATFLLSWSGFLLARWRAGRAGRHRLVCWSDLVMVWVGHQPIGGGPPDAPAGSSTGNVLCKSTTSTTMSSRLVSAYSGRSATKIRRGRLVGVACAPTATTNSARLLESPTSSTTRATCSRNRSNQDPLPKTLWNWPWQLRQLEPAEEGSPVWSIAQESDDDEDGTPPHADSDEPELIDMPLAPASATRCAWYTALDRVNTSENGHLHHLLASLCCWPPVPGSQTVTEKKSVFRLSSLLLRNTEQGVEHECEFLQECLETRGPRSRNVCACFSRFSPVWNRRRQEEGCGSLAQAQASALVDVPTAPRHFFTVWTKESKTCVHFLS